jgi:hypothetical protein
METTVDKITVSYCDVDRLFYIRRNGEGIHSQKTQPTQTDIIEALISDRWTERFNDMREGKKVRVSKRIYWEMLGSVPPIKQTATSFYCGEPYSGNLYYFFHIDENDGKRYGELKPIT